MKTMEINEITHAIIGAAMKVHRALGPGVLESAYEACLEYELVKSGSQVERQKPISIIYEEINLDCGFRADLIVDSKVVVELKAKEKVHAIDQAQLLSHLRLLHLPVGLLINFHECNLQNGIQRIVNNHKE